MKKVKVCIASCAALLVLILVTSFVFAAPCGDTNSNGVIDITDALLIAQYSVGRNPADFDKGAADVNADGSINISDALLVVQYYVGIINNLSCKGPTVTPTPTPTTQTKVKGSEVLVIGESFIAMSHEITGNLQTNARNAGIINANESFRDNSVSGTRLSGGISPNIPQQYQNAIQQGPVKYVIMDGGGNDCLQSGGTASSSNPELQNAVSAAQTLLNKMKSDGVVKVIYFFYPEPQGSYFGDLKAKLDVLRPMIQNVVNSTSNPKCYWLDLRPVFEGKYSQYITSDGIHPTSAGCKATADAIWKVVQQNNFFSTN